MMTDFMRGLADLKAALIETVLILWFPLGRIYRRYF